MKREMKRVKKFGVILALNKMKSGAKREWFSFIPLFLREREIDVLKFSISERIFLFTCGILKQFFSFILVKRFGYDFVLVLGWFR